MEADKLSIVLLVLMGATALTATWGGLRTGLLSATVTSAYVAYYILETASGVSLLPVILGIGVTFGVAALLGRKTERHRSSILGCHTTQTTLEQKLEAQSQLLTQANEALSHNLSEGQHREQTLQATEVRYRSLATKLHSITVNAPIYTFEINREGRVDRVHRSYEGVSFDQILGRMLKDWFPPDQQPAIEDLIEQVFSKSEVKTLEYVIPNLQGDLRYYTAQIAPISIDGSVSHAVLIATDITEHKQLEEVLHKEALIFESIYDGVILTNLRGEIIDWNPGAERMFGYCKAEVLGQTPAILHQPEEAPTLTAQILEGMTSEGRWLGEIRFVRQDGTQGICETTVVPMFDNQGQLVATIGVNHDITQRKQTEEALRQSEERWQLVLRGTNDGIWDHDLQTNQHFLSKQCYEMLGYRYEDVDTFSKWSALIHLEDREQMTRAFQAHLNHQTPFYTAEYRIRCQNGTYKWVISRGQAVSDNAGNPVRAVGSLTDISQRKQAEAELEEYRDRLEQLVEARTCELTEANAKLYREIEARSLLAEALLASEARLAGILDNANDAIISINENQQIILFNQGAEKIFGYKAEDVLNQPLDLLLPQRSVGDHRQHIQQFGQSSQTARNMAGRRDIFGRRRDGTEFPAEASISRLELGDITMYTAILRDISDRVAALQERDKAEIALRESEHRYATLTEVSPVGIFHYDAAGNYSYVNERWSAMAGMSLEQAGGKGWVTAIHPDDRSQVFQTWSEAVQNRCPFQLEYRFLRPDGIITWVVGQAVAESDDSGKILGFVGSVTDINARKQAEAKVQESERRWRSLLENVRLLVVGLNGKGEIEYVNPFFLELTGYTQAEVVGQNWFNTFLPESEKSRIGQLFQENLQQDLHHYYQNTILTKFGEEKIIAWNNTRLQSVEGLGIGTMSIGEDITERYAIERIKNEFISVVSHELRTPLTALHGAIDLLSTGLVEVTTDRGKQVLRIAAESTERLVRLVNDILELERLESGKIKLVKESIDVIDLLWQAKDQMQVMANRAGITLEIAEQDIEFEADSHRLLQVLTNLISNANKYSSQGSTVTLRVELNDEKNVIFAVKDQGRGIPPDKIESIFERFHQVDASDSRQKGGTGLGLAICRSIIEQHGGKIWVESVLNHGSSFYLSIPTHTTQKEN